MRTRFAFGKSGIEVSVPDRFRCRVVKSRCADALKDENTALEAALDHPIGCRPLAELAAGRESAAIAVCDITRPAPNRRTLLPLLTRLHSAGIAAEDITILIATGLHREATKEEIEVIVGPEVAARYRVLSHDARNAGLHRKLGMTRRGTPVSIDERFMAADLHLSLGFVEQHLMLGFSGGRKLVVPGLASQETIKVIHSPRFMREPLAKEGSIAGNPLHAELLEMAEMARHDFILDVTLTLDRKINGVFAGDPKKAHAAAVEFLEATSLERLEEPVDAVITSAAGHPLDLTFYQSIKGISAAQHLVKHGGRILLIGECAEGIGSREFARMLEGFSSSSGFLEEIRDSAVEIDQWQLERLALCGLHYELFFYTPQAPKEKLGLLGAVSFDNLGDAIEALLDGLQDGASIALIPEGPYTFARAEEGATAVS